MLFRHHDFTSTPSDSEHGLETRNAKLDTLPAGGRRQPLRSRGQLFAAALLMLLLLPGCPSNGIQVPVIQAVTPNSIPAGSSAVTLTVTGNNFQSSVITFNGQALPTTSPSAGTLVATVPASMVSTASTATVGVTNLVPSGNVSSGGVQVSITAPAGATIAVTKTHTPSALNPGGTGIITITVSNAGTGPSSGTVAVKDPLPNIFAFVTSASGTGWTCTITPANATSGFIVNCTRSDALPAASSYPAITIQVVVGTATPAGNVTNTVTVSGSTFPSATASDVIPIS